MQLEPLPPSPWVAPSMLLCYGYNHQHCCSTGSVWTLLPWGVSSTPLPWGCHEGRCWCCCCGGCHQCCCATGSVLNAILSQGAPLMPLGRGTIDVFVVGSAIDAVASRSIATPVPWGSSQHGYHREHCDAIVSQGAPSMLSPEGVLSMPSGGSAVDIITSGSIAMPLSWGAPQCLHYKEHHWHCNPRGHHQHHPMGSVIIAVAPQGTSSMPLSQSASLDGITKAKNFLNKVKINFKLGKKIDIQSATN